MDPKLKKLKIVTANIKQPITENNEHRVMCHSVTYQNAGTTKIVINGGWTLFPGGSIGFTNHSNDNMFTNEYKFEFGTSSEIPGQNAENKLEIIEYHVADAQQSHYDLIR